MCNTVFVGRVYDDRPEPVVATSPKGAAETIAEKYNLEHGAVQIGNWDQLAEPNEPRHWRYNTATSAEFASIHEVKI